MWEIERLAKAKKETVDFAPGYKRELISILANMCYRNKRNQDEVSACTPIKSTYSLNRLESWVASSWF